MTSKKNDRNATRAAIVQAAARSCTCTPEDLFPRAVQFENELRRRKGERLIRRVIVNLKRIPRYVVRFARMLLETYRAKIAVVRARERRMRYHRAAACMYAH